MRTVSLGTASASSSGRACIEEILPEKVTWVTIEKDLEKGFDYRRISVEDRG